MKKKKGVQILSGLKFGLDGTSQIWIINLQNQCFEFTKEPLSKSEPFITEMYDSNLNCLVQSKLRTRDDQFQKK